MYGSGSFSQERRSTAGPMDWTPTTLDGSDGQSRKRPHYDPSASPFVSQPSRLPYQSQSHPTYPTFKATPSPLNTPFLFQTPANLDTFSDSSRSTGTNFSFDPSAFNPVTAFGVTPQQPIQEVDMEHELEQPNTDDPSLDNNAAGSESPKKAKGVVSKLAKAATSWYGIASTEDPQQQQEDELEVQPRKVASGAVKREQKKRAQAEPTLGRKRSVRSVRERRRRYDEDKEDEASGSSSSDSNPTSPVRRRPSRKSSSKSTSSRALQRRSDNGDDAVSTQHFNLHLPGRTVSHGEIPYILLGYLQFFFNLSLVLILLYLAVQFILTVKADINRKVEEVSFEILQEIASCTNQYLANQCEPSRRVPAMQQACSGWEYCMNRDPTVFGRAKVGAETFAGVVNSFVDPISWKTMSFTLVTLTFLTIVLNSAFSFYRASHRPASYNNQPPQHQHQWPQHQQYPGLPPAESYGQGGQGYGYPGLPPPQPSTRKRSGEGEGKAEDGAVGKSKGLLW